MTTILAVLLVAAITAWVQAERVIWNQRKALAYSEAVIDAQKAAMDELQQAFHDMAKADRVAEQQTLAAWGVQVH